MGEVAHRLKKAEPINGIEIWDNSKRSKLLIWVFWTLIGFLILSIISGYLELELLKKAQLAYYIDQNEADSNDVRQKIIGILQTIVVIISGIVFLNWFRRAYGNLHRIGINYLEYKESMALWSWFIPIIVLFRPVKIMNEIWKETQGHIKKLDATYQIKNGSFIISTWWILFIISNFIGRYVLKTTFKEETLAQVIDGSKAFLISDILQIPEALLVLLIVYKLSEMESKLALEIRKSGGTIIYK